MKILHFSDTHLWFKINNSDREQDFYDSFLRVIDYAIENKIEIVLHSWDLFHHSKPSNKSLAICIQWLLRLSEAGIQVIMIAGNHSTPRLSTQWHSFDIFTEIKNVNVFFKDYTEAIEIKGINFVNLPHIHDEKKFANELSEAWKYIKDWINIYMSHLGISAQNYDEYTDEISWINIKKSDLESLQKYDYVAMGHYHKNFSIWNIHYSWSLEHTSFNQKSYRTWFNVISIKDSKIEKIDFIQNNSRKMLEYFIDCEGILSTDELLEVIKSKDLDISGHIVKINFENMSTKMILDFDDTEICDFFKDSFYFEYRKIKKSKNTKISSENIKDSDNIIQDSFSDFWDKYEKNIDTHIDKEKLKNDILLKIK